MSQIHVNEVTLFGGPPNILAEAFKRLMGWLDEGYGFSPSVENVIIWKPTPASREHDCNIVAQVSTQSQVYTLTVGYREGNRTVEDLYFGATVKSRRMRAGETWRRGRDLHDGKFTEACWHRILADILSCELVKYQSNEWKGQYGWERPAANESGAV